MWETGTLRTLANDDFGILVENDPLASCEPNVLHISETTEKFIQESSGDRFGAFVLVRCRIRRWDHGKSAIFTTVHSRARRISEPETSLSLSWRKFFLQLRTGRPFSDQFDSLIPNVRQNPRRGSENEQIRILLERQKEQILANYQAKIRKKTNSTSKNFPNVGWSYRVSQKEFCPAHQGDEQLRRDQQLLHELFGTK